MTAIVSATVLSEDFGLVTTLHLDEPEAWEILRSNFCEEIAVGDENGIYESLDNQGLNYDVAVHDIDLSDVSAELPDMAQVYKDIYNALDSHAWGTAAGRDYCVCRGWDSVSEPYTYNDHVTMAVLSKLRLPIAGPTA